MPTSPKTHAVPAQSDAPRLPDVPHGISRGEKRGLFAGGAVLLACGVACSLPLLLTAGAAVTAGAWATGAEPFVAGALLVAAAVVVALRWRGRRARAQQGGSGCGGGCGC